jgi:hypothetical protein
VDEIHNSSSDEAVQPVKRAKVANIMPKPIINLGNPSNDKNGKNVSFLLQSNNDTDMTDEQQQEDYAVLPAALPAWRSATAHRGLEQKANLRYQYLKAELDAGNLPAWTMGLEKAPSYLLPLSADIIALIKQQGMELGRQACIELINSKNSDKALADDHMKVTKLTYMEKSKEEEYVKAENQHAKVVAGYREQEAKKIEAFNSREQRRRPDNDEKLGKLISHRFSRIPEQPEAAEGNPSKRKRGGSSGANTPSRGVFPEPSQRGRGFQTGRERGGSRGPTPTPRGNTQRGGQQRGGRGAPQSNRGIGRGFQPNRGRGYQPSRGRGFQPGRGRGRSPGPSDDDALLRLLCRRMLNNQF